MWFSEIAQYMKSLEFTPQPWKGRKEGKGGPNGWEESKREDKREGEGLLASEAMTTMLEKLNSKTLPIFLFLSRFYNREVICALGAEGKV